MPVGIEAWLTEVPPITRAWMVLSVATSVAVVSAAATFEAIHLTLGRPAMPDGNPCATVL
jgi:hypothetical protein